MFTTTPLIILSAWSADCAEFQARAHFLESNWEQRDRREEAFVALAAYPQQGCAPAERFVLAKRALETSPSLALVQLLLGQDTAMLRGQGLVSLVARIDLLKLMLVRGLIVLEREEQLLLERISRAADELIGTQGARLEATDAAYHELASRLLKRLRSERSGAPPLNHVSKVVRAPVLQQPHATPRLGI